MARAAAVPVSEIAQSVGVSVRTISRVTSAQAGKAPISARLTRTGTLQRMSIEYARAVTWTAYYERRIDQDPDNPRWHDCLLKWAQQSRGLLQDLAVYRGIDEYDKILADDPPGIFPDVDPSFDIVLRKLSAALYQGDDPA